MVSVVCNKIEKRFDKKNHLKMEKIFEQKVKESKENGTIINFSDDIKIAATCKFIYAINIRMHIGKFYFPYAKMVLFSIVFLSLSF